MRFLAFAALLTATPLFAEDAHHDSHLSTAEGIRVLHAWARVGEERVYMDIENIGDHDIILLGGESHDGALMALMAAPISASGGDIQPIPAMPIPAGSELPLTPDGLFLMLAEPAGWAEGSHVDAHVIFDPLGELEIEIEVLAADTDQHPHAGHAH